MRINSSRGFTLVELLVVAKIVAILADVAATISAEYGSESRCVEIHNVLPQQIIRSQTHYYVKHNQCYVADRNQLKDYGVDLSEVNYFTYSSFPNQHSSFLTKADATEWVAKGWGLYDHRVERDRMPSPYLAKSPRLRFVIWREERAQE